MSKLEGRRIIQGLHLAGDSFGNLRPVVPRATAPQTGQAIEGVALIMLVYLGVGSQFNREGKLWIQAEQVSEFILNSLLKR